MRESDIWMSFKNEILFKNRFADSKEIKQILNQIFNDYCKYKVVKKGTILYRARQIDNSEMNVMGPDYYGFDEKHSLAPPVEITSPGRLNCSKLPILYLAEDEYTALSEIRPAKKSKVSVASVEIKRDIKLLEFNYFENTHNDDIKIASIIDDIKLLLYMPVMDSYKEEYLPTQFLASCIKEEKYDGIAYSSSQSNKGMNIGVFDVEIGHVIKSKVFLLQSVLYYAEEVLPRSDSTFLVPTSIGEKFSREEIQKFLDNFELK